MRNLRAATPPETLAAKQAAFRAGMRKDKCAICGNSIDGHGICDICDDHVRALGGLDGLKQAVRAVRYLQSE
jgi:recombinational DNA repair protein RecR